MSCMPSHVHKAKSLYACISVATVFARALRVTKGQKVEGEKNNPMDSSILDVKSRVLLTTFLSLTQDLPNSSLFPSTPTPILFTYTPLSA